MGTKTITPRTHNDGQIGSASKYWNKGYFNELNINTLNGISSIVFEGSSPDDHETTLSITNPTADRTITFPDASGTVAFTSDITTYSAGTGIDLAGSTFNLDLTEVIADDSANRLLTSDGDGTLSAESGLTYVPSSEQLTLNGTSDVEITSDARGGYDVINFAYGTLHFTPYNVFGTGIGNLIEVKDFGSGSASGGSMNIKSGGGYGTNKGGGNIELVAGRGTGTAAGGQLRFWSSPAGSSGSSYNTSALKFTVDSVGDANVYGDLTVAGGDITLSGTGRIQGIDTVSASTDAASKSYVDGLISDETVSAGSFISKQVKVTLSQANCNSLHSIPIELIPAQGSNTIIVPAGGILMVDRNAAQNNTAADLNFHYADKEPGTYGQTALFHIRRFMYGNLTDIVYSLGELSGIEISQNLTDCVNKGVEVSVDSALTSNCMTSITIYLTYHVIDIS